MKGILFVLNEVWLGKSVTRAFLNLRLREDVLRGKTVDIGGGDSSDYIGFMRRSDDTEFVSLDIKTDATLDFEKDKLPIDTNSCDTVLFLNVMEHIFDYHHIAAEVVRIIRPGGKLIGFVPFLMLYHPDHSDYFRYTNEALTKIFENTGAQRVTVASIHRGPFIASAQMFLTWLPRLVRVPIFLTALFLDLLFIRYKPVIAERYALGYYFTVEK